MGKRRSMTDDPGLGGEWPAWVGAEPQWKTRLKEVLVVVGFAALFVGVGLFSLWARVKWHLWWR